MTSAGSAFAASFATTPAEVAVSVDHRVGPAWSSARGVHAVDESVDVSSVMTNPVVSGVDVEDGHGKLPVVQTRGWGKLLRLSSSGLGQRVAALRKTWEARLVERRASEGIRRPRAGSALLASVDSFPDMPAFRARDLAERLQVTWRAAQDAILELEGAGIVEQVSAGKGNRSTKPWR